MIKRFVLQLLAAVYIVGAFTLLAGCNTVEGAGKDIERGGAAIKDEAREKR